jgi:hypothetical protein
MWAPNIKSPPKSSGEGEERDEVTPLINIRLSVYCRVFHQNQYIGYFLLAQVKARPYARYLYDKCVPQ